ncbi:hypothetical protein L226DRAFT_76414 [Lentinus tigrinus ALCF2SS1-7]|uniref:Uncharacterized protein n=1 Tax=Lentinus tigrinus ALCF2SS1-6 TaxID=1328759 RepID=A0A5C2SFN4_9APHY|nr:hypothetical protein L227DRAFT_573884 [Lentinus tigrinus ALCF2SS1-6]RPD74510.1 hypothetical protein L226DRAFT_76414 [Lentinus tigrinus ALCF2SS1-7]
MAFSSKLAQHSGLSQVYLSTCPCSSHTMFTSLASERNSPFDSLSTPSTSQTFVNAKSGSPTSPHFTPSPFKSPNSSQSFVPPSSQTGSPAHQLIPEPPNGTLRAYGGYIREPHRDDYEAAKLFIRELVRKELDVQLAWSQQKATARRIVFTVIASYPVFLKYANKWPILYYAYQSHCRFRTEARREGRVSARRKVRVPIGCGVPSSTYPRSPGSQTTVPTTLPSRPPCYPSQGLPTTQTLHVESSDRDRGADHASMTFRGRKEVEMFLQTLPLQLGALTDRFVSAGLSSQARLQIMAQWTVADQETFLRREVSVDAFVSKLVCDALRPSFRVNTM